MSFETIESHLVFVRALRPNSLVVDGGAHKGWFSRTLASRFHCRCVGFEPSPDLFQALPQLEGVTFHHAALAGVAGPVRLGSEVSAPNPMGSALTHLGSKGDAGVEVPGLNFAAMLSVVGGGPIDLLKLDIEGAEIEFLDSATDEDLARVGQITVEFHDHCGITPPAEIERLCRRLNGLGFQRLWSSWRPNTHDTLFVHRRVLPRWRYILQMYPVRFLRAVGRATRRQIFGTKPD
jgi:FkbM family methyltransferase